MSQDQANVLQGSRPLGPPLVAPQFRPALSRENPFQQATLPPTAASESREPLSVNFHNLLQHRSLPGQQHSGPQRALFVQQGGQPSAGAVGDPELQRGASVDRRKKGSWKRRRESFDLPSRCIVPQCNEAAPTCCAQCTSVSLQLPLCFVVHSASVPDALKQLDLNQYLELMEDNEVGGGAERGGEGSREEGSGRAGEGRLCSSYTPHHGFHLSLVRACLFLSFNPCTPHKWFLFAAMESLGYLMTCPGHNSSGCVSPPPLRWTWRPLPP